MSWSRGLDSESGSSLDQPGPESGAEDAEEVIVRTLMFRILFSRSFKLEGALDNWGTNMLVG